MSNTKTHNTKNLALHLCVTAMFAALLVGGKQALAVIPNVEVVTIVIAVCAYCWGLSVAIPAVFVFIAVDTAIWGIGTWVVSYIIHWNVVAIAFWLFSKIPFKRSLLAVFATLLAVVLTALFGVLTSFVDVVLGFVGGFFWNWSNVLPRFAVMYASGVVFFVTQIVCNLVVFALGFVPLVAVNKKAKLQMFGQEDCPAHTNAEAPNTPNNACPQTEAPNPNDETTNHSDEASPNSESSGENPI